MGLRLIQTAVAVGRWLIGHGDVVSAIVLASREKAIVELLAEGHADASVARRLGVSQRTVTYTLRALMDRIGVENRFQLGLVLGATQAVKSSAD